MVRQPEPGAVWFCTLTTSRAGFEHWVQLCLPWSEGHHCHKVPKPSGQLSVLTVALARCHFKPTVGITAEVSFPEGEHFKGGTSRELPSL